MKKSLLSKSLLALLLTAGAAGATFSIAGNAEAPAVQAGDVDFFAQLGTREAPASVYLTEGSTDDHFYTTLSNVASVVNEFAWNLKSEMEMNATSDPVTVVYAENALSAPTTLFTIEANSPVFDIEPAFPAFGMDGVFGIYLTEEQKSKFDKAGEYVLSFPAGYFQVEEEDVAAFSIAITVEGGSSQEENYEYVLYPEAGSTVESLSTIELEFPTASSVTYCDADVANLKSADGSVDITVKYPTIDSKSLVFNFAEPDGGWPAGEYTLTVYDKQVCVNPGITFEDEPGTGNVGTITAQYTVASQVKYGELADVLILNTPDDIEANRKNTVTQFGQSGMGVLAFYLNQPIKTVGGNDMILYSYKPTEDGEVEVLNVINPLDSESGLLFISAAPSIDYGDEGDFSGMGMMYMLMAKTYDNNGVVVDPSQFPTYRRNGYYTLEIPDGIFALEDGTVLKGLTLTYAYDDSEDVYGTGYTLSPEPGTYQSAAELFDVDSEGIKVTFSDAKFVDYNGRCATLTLPDGQVLSNNTPKGGYNKTWLTFTFGLRNVDWSAKGEYVFEVLAEAVGLDQGFSEDWSDAGLVPNFPGLKAIYIISDTSAVWAIDLEKSENYTVYTLDGKALLLNAPAESLTTLNAGIYVINGRTVRIAK